MSWLPILISKNTIGLRLAGLLVLFAEALMCGVEQYYAQLYACHCVSFGRNKTAQ
jgi:hypothetical protein